MKLLDYFKYNMFFVMVLALSLFATGCSKESGEVPEQNITGVSTVKISFSLPAVAWSKALSVNPVQVSNANVYVCSPSGAVINCTYLKGTSALSLHVQKGEKYRVYVIANAGKAIILKDESEIKGYSFTIERAEQLADNSGGVLMSGTAGPIELSDGAVVPVNLTRCIAKVVVKGDKSSLNAGVNIVLNSMIIRNMPRKIKLFGTSKTEAESDVMDGYVLSASELSAFFTSGIEFYLYENMQGTLQPSNAEQKNKVWPESSIYSKICSYLQMNASYSSAKHSGTLLYRFYLGKDMTGNYDVERNTRHTVTVYFAGEGSVDENTWRVDTELLTDLITSISLSPSSLEILGLSQTKKITAAVLPETASDKTLVWSSSDTGTASVDQSGNVTSKGFGTCTITAKSADGSGISSSVTVKVVGGEVNFPAGPLAMFDGQIVKVNWAKLVPPDGIPSVSSSNNSVASVSSVSSDGVTVQAVSAGSAVLTASIGTSTSKLTVNVEPLAITFTGTQPLSVFNTFNTAIDYKITPSSASSLKLKWSVAEASGSSYISFPNEDTPNVVRGIKVSDAAHSVHTINVSPVDYPSKVFTVKVKVLPAVKIVESQINLLANAYTTAETGATYSNIGTVRYATCVNDPDAAVTWKTGYSDYFGRLKVDSATGRLTTETPTRAHGKYYAVASVTGDDGTVSRDSVLCIVWEEINAVGKTEYQQEGEEDGYPTYTAYKTIEVTDISKGYFDKTVGTNFVTLPVFNEDTEYGIIGAVGDGYNTIQYTTFTYPNPFDSTKFGALTYRYYVSSIARIDNE